ncbi:13740_t:CDS:2, partial [Gigaspora rosea]
GVEIWFLTKNVTSEQIYCIVVTTDYITKWPKAKAIGNANANEVADFIYDEYCVESEELLEEKFLQWLFDLIKVLLQSRAAAGERVEQAQELAK